MVAVARTLGTSALVGAAASVRAGVGAAELALRRGPSLVALGVRATVPTGAGAARADAGFRDELLMLLDEVGELTWRQVRRARLELDERTGPADGPAPTGAHHARLAASNGAAHRRHRVKA